MQITWSDVKWNTYIGPSLMCYHLHPNPDGVCSKCNRQTCKMGLPGCFCSVGWPYELQCLECRDMPRRFDNGYCCCTPTNLPDRGHIIKLCTDLDQENSRPAAQTLFSKTF